MLTLPSGDPEEMTARLRHGFGAWSGAPAEVVARAPGRVNLVGEHTDYNDGLCLPMALPHASYVAGRRRTDGRVRVESRQQSTGWEGALADIAPGRVDGWAAYAVGVLWAMREAGFDVPGVDLLLDSTVPVGAGLSSSAAVEAAVGMAVVGMLGETDSPELRERLVAACVRAETEVAGAPTGGMDQTVALFAEAGSALRLDFGDGSRRSVALGIEEPRLTLLVTDTGVAHALVAGGYGDRRRQCRDAAAALDVSSLRAARPDAVATLADPLLRRRARHVLDENDRVDRLVEAVGRQDWTTAGRVLSASHVSLRDDFEVTCAELDAAVEAATAAGALGARMTGGGFGGSTVALVPTAAVTGVAAAIDRAFAGAGWQPPRHLVAAPSAAADVTG